MMQSMMEAMQVMMQLMQAMQAELLSPCGWEVAVPAHVVPGREPLLWRLQQPLLLQWLLSVWDLLALLLLMVRLVRPWPVLLLVVADLLLPQRPEGVLLVYPLLMMPLHDPPPCQGSFPSCPDDASPPPYFAQAVGPTPPPAPFLLLPRLTLARARVKAAWAMRGLDD